MAVIFIDGFDQYQRLHDWTMVVAGVPVQHELTDMEWHLTGELAATLVLPILFRVERLENAFGVRFSTMTIAVFYVQEDQLMVFHRQGERLVSGSGQSGDRYPLADADLIESLQAKISQLCTKFIAGRKKELEVNRSWRQNVKSVPERVAGTVGNPRRSL